MLKSFEYWLLLLTSTESSAGFTPIRDLSSHSNMTTLTIGSSLSGMLSGLTNFRRMKGSTLPPQAVSYTHLTLPTIYSV